MNDYIENSNVCNISNDFKRQKINDIKFQASCVIFWLLACALFNYLQYTGGIIISLLFIVRYFTLEKQDRFAFIFSGLPFQALNKVRDGLPSTVILVYAIFIASYIIYQKYQVKRKDVGCLVVILILQTIAMVRFDAGIVSIISAILSIIFARIALYNLLDYENIENMYCKCAWAFSIAVVIDVVASSYLFPRLPYYVYFEKTTLMATVSRFSGLNGDPNYYGQLIIIAISFMIALSRYYLKRKEIVYSIICLGGVIFLSISGLNSGSKGYAVSLSFILVMAMYFIFTEGKKPLAKIIAFSFFVIVGSFISVIMYNYVVVPMIASRTNTDLFTGRLEIWASYLQLFCQDPSIIFLGTGFTNGLNVVKSIFGEAEASHNLYIEILGDVGIIGIVTLMRYWSSAFFNIKNLFNNITTLFVWGFLVSSFSLSASANDVIYFIIPIMGITFAIRKMRR